MDMDNDLKRSIILENYQNPTNKSLVEDNSYKKINTNSKSCIDQLDIQIKIEDGIIKDIRFDGESCAICTSSTSIMIRTLIGETVTKALEIINNFESMIDEKEYKEELIGEGVVYCDISKQPNRKNCALLAWRGVKQVLEEYKDDKKE